MTPQEIYNQSIDKQRIVIVGEGNGLITSIVEYVLSSNKRKVDIIKPDHPTNLRDDAPSLVIQANDQLLDYKHHIVILSKTSSANQVADFEQLAAATPKGGTIIYSEHDEEIKKIGSKVRADVQLIPYNVYKHEVKEGQTVLITSTKEKFPVALRATDDLQYISAAKELLKKMGITSGQFYQAMSAYRP